MGGPFMMNLKVAVELRSPFSSHAFCVAPRMLRDMSDMLVVHDMLGDSASPLMWQVVSSSVVTKPDSIASLQQVNFAVRYWRSSIQEKSAPLPRRELPERCIGAPPL